MTLDEYMNQALPARAPYVELQEGEYWIGPHTDGPGPPLADVQIEGLPYRYKNYKGSPLLFTSDEDGNPKRVSCFNLPKNGTPGAIL